MAYKKDIPITGGFYPMDNGNFPLVNAHEVYINDSTRLDDELSDIAATEAAFNALGLSVDSSGYICQTITTN